MAEGCGIIKENRRSVANRTSWTEDNLFKDPGERKSVLRKKSLIPVVEQEGYSEQITTIMCSDMPEEMQEFAIKCAVDALVHKKFKTEKDVATYIRKEMEERYTPIWHCIVGKTFGSYVSHESKHYIYFSVGPMGIVVFKSG